MHEGSDAEPGERKVPAERGQTAVPEAPVALDGIRRDGPLHERRDRRLELAPHPARRMDRGRRDGRDRLGLSLLDERARDHVAEHAVTPERVAQTALRLVGRDHRERPVRRETARAVVAGRRGDEVGKRGCADLPERLGRRDVQAPLDATEEDAEHRHRAGVAQLTEHDDRPQRIAAAGRHPEHVGEHRQHCRTPPRELFHLAPRHPGGCSREPRGEHGAGEVREFLAARCRGPLRLVAHVLAL
ncbi:MAG: hypothetical protein AUJ03_01145 [Deltaproteobacteria bacterium 13_1_40CM_3_71_4]|nr:MAG: hypothetical protein AUJ03_01145 [Deltaproteobacteria bacterium 13_1_40CM_3_71_4]